MDTNTLTLNDFYDGSMTECFTAIVDELPLRRVNNRM